MSKLRGLAGGRLQWNQEPNHHDVIAKDVDFIRRPPPPVQRRVVLPGDVLRPPRSYRRTLGEQHWTSWEVAEVAMLLFFAGVLFGLCVVPR